MVLDWFGPFSLRAVCLASVPLSVVGIWFTDGLWALRGQAFVDSSAQLVLPCLGELLTGIRSCFLVPTHANRLILIGPVSEALWSHDFFVRTSRGWQGLNFSLFERDMSSNQVILFGKLVGGKAALTALNVLQTMSSRKR